MSSRFAFGLLTLCLCGTADFGRAQDSSSPPVISQPVISQPVISQPVISPMEPSADQPDGFALPPPLAPGPRGLSSLGLTASLGVTRGSYSYAPAMIGDFFGGSFLFTSDANEEFNSGGSLGNVTQEAATIAIAGGDRRFKIAENVSPVPHDRAFFNYNHFENALNDYLGRSVSLDRYTAGIEKTFFDQMTSIEIRLPFAQGLNSKQDFNSTDTEGLELSNLSIAFKSILLAGDQWLISGGTTLTLPTGDGYIEAFDDLNYFFIDNDAIHLAPFVGWLVLPSERWFAQGFVQTDFDLNGNQVRHRSLGELGKIQDQNLLFVDASIGYWLLQRSQGRGQLNGIATITELHYTMTMNDSDEVGGVSNPFGHVDVLNLTAALHFQFGVRSMRFGAAAPLRDDEERLYDAEIIAQFSQTF